MFEYIAPYVSATIGGWTTAKTSSVNVTSSQLNPIDIAELTIPVEGYEVSGIKKGMPVEIYMGYREKGLWPVFYGKVADVSSGRELTISAKDMMEILRQTTITKSFVDAVPQEIIKYALGKAGVENFWLDNKAFPKRHHFVAKNISVIQLIQLVNRTWSVDWPFYFEPEGQFFWGQWQNSSRFNSGQAVASFEYGQNILALQPSDNATGLLTTFLLPFIKHSNLIIIRDSRYWDTEICAKVERVTYKHGAQGTEMEMQWQILEN